MQNDNLELEKNTETLIKKSNLTIKQKIKHQQVLQTCSAYVLNKYFSVMYEPQ